MTSRKIAVMTGKRGGYGAMKPLLQRLHEGAETELFLIVTDQHLDAKFGNSSEEVARDFPVAAKLPLNQQGDSGRERAKALAACVSGMADLLADAAPDILVLYGDRGEALATALAATQLGIPIAHLQGGDVSGNIDEAMRHALSKLAHLHFVATPESGERLRRMGEEDWRVHVVGDNHVDPIVSGDYAGKAATRHHLGLAADDRPIVVLQHPETIRKRDHYADMRGTLEAVLALSDPVIAIYPCSDPGHDAVIRAIESFQGHANLTIRANIDSPIFRGLLAISRVLVGNSSAGLIETPYFPIPAVNVGERQSGRQRSENVIDCEMGRASVAAALDTALNDADFAARVRHCQPVFGDGQAGQRVFDVLTSVPLDERLLAKRMTY